MSSNEVESGSSPPHSTRFTIDEEIRRQYRRFNAEGTELTVRLLPPPSDGDDTDPITHFQASVTELFRYALRDCQDSDMVGLTIRNEVNVQDKPIGFNFRWKYQISEDVVWSVFEKVVESNARFNALDSLIVAVHRVAMPTGYGRAVKTKGRQLSVMAHLKSSIIEVKAEQNCLAHALIIVIARLEKDSNYNYNLGYVPRSTIYFRREASIWQMVEASESSLNSRIIILITVSSSMLA